MPTITMPPGTGIFVQEAGRNVYIPWDGTTGLNLQPGSGVLSVTHKGADYEFRAADPAATDPRIALTNPTPVEPGWTKKTLDGAHDSIQRAVDMSGANAELTIVGRCLQMFRFKDDMVVNFTAAETVQLG